MYSKALSEILFELRINLDIFGNFFNPAQSASYPGKVILYIKEKFIIFIFGKFPNSFSKKGNVFLFLILLLLKSK